MQKESQGRERKWLVQRGLLVRGGAVVLAIALAGCGSNSPKSGSEEKAARPVRSGRPGPEAGSGRPSQGEIEVMSLLTKDIGFMRSALMRATDMQNLMDTVLGLLPNSRIDMADSEKVDLGCRVFRRKEPSLHRTEDAFREQLLIDYRGNACVDSSAAIPHASLQGRDHYVIGYSKPIPKPGDADRDFGYPISVVYKNSGGPRRFILHVRSPVGRINRLKVERRPDFRARLVMEDGTSAIYHATYEVTDRIEFSGTPEGRKAEFETRFADAWIVVEKADTRARSRVARVLPGAARTVVRLENDPAQEESGPTAESTAVRVSVRVSFEYDFEFPTPLLRADTDCGLLQGRYSAQRLDSNATVRLLVAHSLPDGFVSGSHHAEPIELCPENRGDPKFAEEFQALLM